MSSNNRYRRQQARDVRVAAADIAFQREHPEHVANGDETRHRLDMEDPCGNPAAPPSHLMSFTKGLPHCPCTGLLQDADHFAQFVRAIDSGDPRDFRDTPLAHPANCCGNFFSAEDLGGLNDPCDAVWISIKAKTGSCCGKGDGPVAARAWESQGAGLTFDLEGPDAQAVTMPPAPRLGSDELTGEMAEVYAQALLRDTPFSTMMLNPSGASGDLQGVLSELNQLPWFAGTTELSDAERSRHRPNLQPHTAFRGLTPGDLVGPYLSQFLLAGNRGVNSCDTSRSAAEGLITYGSVTIDQRVRNATDIDYLTSWDEWLDVQNGANLGGLEQYNPTTKYRFITTPRDLATYVHYDALYEAYLNACLLMLGAGVPFDRGIPFQQPDNLDHQQGFAHFGGPHILSLVTEVATRALKAVRFQKFNVHRRLRPEALAGRLEKVADLRGAAPELGAMHDEFQGIGLLDRVRKHNQSSKAQSPADTVLLPMAFCEGSPMHPAYGAGHATVAGACVTILKAFFDHDHPLGLNDAKDPSIAYVPDPSGAKLTTVPVVEPDSSGAPRPAILSVEGELNKLASNISIGRDWAGVHFYTDYIESIRLGERIALGILEEQKITYGENFSMTVPLFDGGAVRI